jgi:hypothetical protein
MIDRKTGAAGTLAKWRTGVFMVFGRLCSLGNFSLDGLEILSLDISARKAAKCQYQESQYVAEDFHGAKIGWFVADLAQIAC